MSKSARIVTAVLGVLMFLPGLNKFFEPAKTKFFIQLTLSELPFPTFSYWLAIWGEVAVGLALVLLASCENRFAPALRKNIFNLCHLMISVMMLVAIYVHLHPAVPEEVLPPASKISIYANLLFSHSVCEYFSK